MSTVVIVIQVDPQPCLVMDQPKSVKEFVQSYSMSGIIKKKRETNSLERKQTCCGVFFNGDTGKPNMFEDAM